MLPSMLLPLRVLWTEPDEDVVASVECCEEGVARADELFVVELMVNPFVSMFDLWSAVVVGFWWVMNAA